MNRIKDSILQTVGETLVVHIRRLQPGQTAIGATSGNTGIGLAMVCARKGYPLVIVMAERGCQFPPRKR